MYYYCTQENGSSYKKNPCMYMLLSTVIYNGCFIMYINYSNSLSFFFEKPIVLSSKILILKIQYIHEIQYTWILVVFPEVKVEF